MCLRPSAKIIFCNRMGWACRSRFCGIISRQMLWMPQTRMRLNSYIFGRRHRRRMLRWRAEGHMQHGGTFAESFVASLSLQNARPSRHQKSLILARTHGHLGESGNCAADAWRVSPRGKRGDAQQQRRFASLARGSLCFALKRDQNGGVEARQKRATEWLVRKYPKTGRRNRRYLRDSEYHLSPRRPHLARVSAGTRFPGSSATLVFRLPSDPHSCPSDTRVPQRPSFSAISSEEQSSSNREVAQTDKAALLDFGRAVCGIFCDN